MKKIVLMIILVFSLALPVSAEEITAPPVPESGEEFMPRNTDSFSDALWEMIRKAIGTIQPDLQEAASVCTGIIGIVLLLSILQAVPGNSLYSCELTGVVGIGVLLLKRTNALIHLGANTVMNMNGYGNLLLPVMTAAMAAQGGISSSAAIYAGTALFSSILSSMISGLLISMVFGFLAVSVAKAAVGENTLKQLLDFIKWLMVWTLKIILYIFTGYMGITGVISGATDAATLKAAKLTISGMVPVVGNILSDASEAVLVSAGVVKNAAGIYGLLAILAVCIGPFLKIGVHYLMLKATAAVCSIFGSKRITELVGDVSSAMGLLLAMTGSECLLLLISVVCFMKGVG